MSNQTEAPVYWLSPVGATDDFNEAIGDVIYDARTIHGPWALMSPASFQLHGGTSGRLGVGYGQRYDRQADGRWLKVEG
jgi:hypothetical protein